MSVKLTGKKSKLADSIGKQNEELLKKSKKENELMLTKLKQAEELLRESETRFEALHKASFGGIAIHDKGVIVECNQGLSEMTGFSEAELIGMNGLLLIAEKSRDAVMNKIMSGYEKPYEAIGLRKGGEEYPIRIEGRNVFYRGKNVRTTEFRDITEIKRAEEEQKKLQTQLMKAQKIEAIGTLAGGIAHDFNNILSAIIGYSELSLFDAEPGTKMHGNLKKILKAGDRAKKLVNQILTFSRQSERELSPVRLKLIVNEVVKFIRATLPTSMEIKKNIKDDPTVIADPTQIHQIMMNLCTNAGHAMQDKGGTLEIGLECTELDPDFIKDYSELMPCEYVKLTISDTGTGIAPENLDKIFDPYFSTKEKEKGTGLGLATVHGIAKSHGGAVTVESRVGKGTTFEVYLPLARDNGKVEKDSRSIPKGGSERILFVDDEKDIIEIAQKMLEQLGYTVTATDSAEDALKIFSGQATEIDLVVSDMTMPKITGDKLAGKLIDIRPDIPVILCTGYSSRITHESLKEMGVTGMVMKPITLYNLAKAVRKALD